MRSYVARRLLYALFVLAGVSVVVFFLVRLSGDQKTSLAPSVPSRA